MVHNVTMENGKFLIFDNFEIGLWCDAEIFSKQQVPLASFVAVEQQIITNNFLLCFVVCIQSLVLFNKNVFVVNSRHKGTFDYLIHIRRAHQ